MADEASIVWLKDCGQLRYVRQTLCLLPTRTRPPRKDTFAGVGEVVGYATLKPNSEGWNGRFNRRVFWLKPYDWPNPGPYSNNGRPCEAVDPKLIRVEECCDEYGNGE